MKTLLAIVLTAAILPATASAGDQTNIRGLGMARTSVAASRGLDAIGINPANLAYEDDANVTLSLFPVGVGVGSNFLTYGMYNKFFTGVDSPTGRVAKNLSEGDKQELLNAFPGGVGTVGADAEIRPIGLAIRFGKFATFALTTTERVAATGAIPSSYAKFVLEGMTPGSTYDFSGAHGSAAWTRQYALSAGFNLPAVTWFRNWSGGVSVKIVHGFAYAGMTRDNTWISAGNDGSINANIDMAGVTSHADFSHSPFPAPAGSGIGADVGISAEVNDYLIAAISLTDIGSMQWTGDVKEMYGQGQLHLDDMTNRAQRDSLQNAVSGSTRPGASFSTGLPTTLRMGVQAELKYVPFIKEFFHGEMTAACDYTQGFSDFPGSSKVGRLSMGLEYRPWEFLPLRTGVGFGGVDRFDFALGFGIRLWAVELEFASDNIGWLFSNDSFSRASVGMGITVRM